MSKKTDSARLRFALAKIDDLQRYQARFPTLEALFQDAMALDAVLMCLLQIGETLPKVENKSWASQLPIQGTSSLRNIIAHNCEGVDFASIERVVTEFIPPLRETILKCLAEAGT